MDRLVLVTFATRYGSTAETAQAVARTLPDGGVAVDLLPIREVASLDRYYAVVLGAPLCVGRLHNEARQFLAARREALARIPVALFVPGPIDSREKDWAGARQQLDKELARHPWFKPVACRIVGGTFDPRELGFPWRFIPAIEKVPVSDARDWTTIRRWATDLAPLLRW